MTETGTGSARALTAEAIASFALIFIGAGAAIALGVNHDTPVVFAHGLTLLVIVAVLGDISGGHFNPAVTVGLATPHILAQLAGDIVAAWVLLLTYGGPVNSLGVNVPTRACGIDNRRHCAR